MKTRKLSLLDTDQIIKMKFDETMDADRVMLVGGEKLELSIDSDKIANAIKESLSDFKFMSENRVKVDLQPQIQSVENVVFVPQIEYKTLEVPVIVTQIEYKEIEKIVYIPQIEYKTIEIPVITERIVTLERPVYITEFKEIVKERYYPLTIKIATIFQALCMGILLLINLLRK
jgi:hypothetical protein